MTNNDAIKLIEQLKEEIVDLSDNDIQALTLAIKALEDKPQGKWIDHSEEGYVECPICDCLTNCDDNIDELHYCWNCGAYMGKGGAE